MFNSQHMVVHEIGAQFNGPCVHRPKSAVSRQRTSMSEYLLARTGRAPHSEPAADKPSETKAFPQPPSAPLQCAGTGTTQQWGPGRHPLSPRGATSRRALP